MTPLTLTTTQARRLAISRQCLAGSSPAGPVTPDAIMRVMRNLGYLQLDPLRVVERTQLLVLWSRLGPYDLAALDTLLWQERLLFEYWAHAAAIVLTENYPIHQLQMQGFADGQRGWQQRVRLWLTENAAFRTYVLDEMRQRGAVSADELEDRSVTAWGSSGWTNARNVTQMLSFLWEHGEVMVADRKILNKRWALRELWLSPEVLAQAGADLTLSTDQRIANALQIALRALGVATARQISRHFTPGVYRNVAPLLAQLVQSGQVVPVQIHSDSGPWPEQWYLHAADLPLLDQMENAWQPRTTLLSPFDNLIIDRDRTERLWDFYYRVEIYVPAAKRQYGYYVLPILHGDRLIGRLDPKLDRKTKTLHINALYAEPDAPTDRATTQAIRQAIASLATFVGARAITFHNPIPAGWDAVQ